jgi:hypothetical protein
MDGPQEPLGYSDEKEVTCPRRGIEPDIPVF